MYPINFGLGESILDAVFIAVATTLVFFGTGRVAPLLRRFANREAKPS